MSTKVKECTSCGQGFDEDNGLIGNRAPSIRCQNGHEGPIVRINTQGKLLLMPLLALGVVLLMCSLLFLLALFYR